jgi:hypothetical protein
VSLSLTIFIKLFIINMEMWRFPDKF